MRIGPITPSTIKYDRNYLEIFRSLDRRTLEAAQLVCRQWHRLVAANHSELPLRRIEKLTISYSDYYRLFFREKVLLFLFNQRFRKTSIAGG